MIIRILIVELQVEIVSTNGARPQMALYYVYILYIQPRVSIEDQATIVYLRCAIFKENDYRRRGDN